MIRIAIAEDERSCAQKLQAYIQRYADDHGLEVAVTWFECQRHLKMSFSAEIKCHFSPGSIQVYTALITDRLVGLKPVKS